MKIFKKFQVFIDYSTNFLINSIASGGGCDPLAEPLQMHVPRIFWKFSNLNWVLAQTRKTLPLDFLISFRIINALEYPTKLTFIIIKISFLNKK